MRGGEWGWYRALSNCVSVDIVVCYGGVEVLWWSDVYGARVRVRMQGCGLWCNTKSPTKFLKFVYSVDFIYTVQMETLYSLSSFHFVTSLDLAIRLIEPSVSHWKARYAPDQMKA